MSEIEKFKQGAEILQQVDVTDIITSLAVGIADAQEQLDNNSIKQALALADPNNGIGGKSLLSMGFAPAFYHFQHADVSAEIALKMRLQTEFELDASLSFNYTQQGGYSAEKLDLLQADHSDKSRTEYKSSRSFVTHANNYEDLAIESEKVKMDQSKGCVTRVEDFADQIRSIEKIDRVQIKVHNENHLASNFLSDKTSVMGFNAGGYFVITVPQNLPDDEGILKVTDYTLGANDSTDVEFAGTTGAGNAEFEIGANGQTDFGTVFAASESAMTNGTVIGFNTLDHMYYESDGNTGAGPGTSIEVYFAHDKWDVNTALSSNLSDANKSVDNTLMIPILEKLALALKEDDDAKIEIIGHTDGSGKEAYNLNLSKQRSGSLADWFIARGVDGSKISATGTGEAIAQTDQSKNLTFRKVELKFKSKADYFFFKGGPFNQVNASTTDSINEFIYLKEGGLASNWPLGVSFEVGGVKYLDETAGTYANLTEIAESNLLKDQFSTQVMYLLHNQSQVKYTTFSKESETQTYAIGSREEEDFSDTESKYLIDETINTKKRVKKDQESRKNPSTIAVGASVDIRVARQFEMDVSGNSKVSARLVSLPAPPEFLDEIKSYYNQ